MEIGSGTFCHSSLFGSRVGGSWGAKRGYRIVEIDDAHRVVSYHMNAEDGEITNTHEVPA